jgi:hypothetical protein
VRSELRLDDELRRKLTNLLVEDYQLQPPCEYLTALKSAHLEAARYSDARSVAQLLESCRSEIHARAPIRPLKPPIRDPSQMVAGQQLVKYDHLLQDHEEKAREKLIAMEVKHRDDLEALEKEWREVMPDKYRRPSKY